ncbi:MAG: hypothetical protein VX527_10640 [Planctomycetota bacterium]|nr:hypothetical protein [Planctomycetota bacterium]
MKLKTLTTGILLIGMSTFSFAQDAIPDSQWQAQMEQRAQEIEEEYETLPTLELKMNALRDMNAAVGNQLKKVNKVIEYMETYLKEHDLWKAYNLPDIRMHLGDHNKDGVINMLDLDFKLDFDEALDIASMYQEEDEAEPKNEESPDQRRVTAFEDVVRKSWRNLNDKMAQVQDMSEFLVERDQFQDFVEWGWERYDRIETERRAKFEEKSRNAVDEQITRNANANRMLNERKQQLADERQERIQFAWEQYKFNQEQFTERYKYNRRYRNGNWNGYGRRGWGW